MIDNLIQIGVSPKICGLIAAIYEQFHMVVRDFHGSVSEPLSINKRVLKSDGMSPFLFIATLCIVLKKAPVQPIQLPDGCIDASHEYVDDVAQLHERKDRSQHACDNGFASGVENSSAQNYVSRDRKISAYRSHYGNRPGWDGPSVCL